MAYSEIDILLGNLIYWNCVRASECVNDVLVKWNGSLCVCVWGPKSKYMENMKIKTNLSLYLKYIIL
jgi:hypothetical protein